jgi:hypothetical protein
LPCQKILGILGLLQQRNQMWGLEAGSQTHMGIPAAMDLPEKRLIPNQKHSVMWVVYKVPHRQPGQWSALLPGKQLDLRKNG